MRYTEKPSASNCLFRLTCRGRSGFPWAFNSMKAILPPGRSTRRSGTPSRPGLTNFGASPPISRTAFTSFDSMVFSRIRISCVLGTPKALYARICVLRVLSVLYSYFFRFIRKVRNTGTREPIFFTTKGAAAVPLGCSRRSSNKRGCPSELVPMLGADAFCHWEHSFGTKTYCGP